MGPATKLWLLKDNRRHVRAGFYFNLEIASRGRIQSRERCPIENSGLTGNAVFPRSGNFDP
jgi:hypothetical protein